ncbi:DUF5677 domain-containing protein [Streptomyces sp. NPDC056132]|uniref:DUF5677 domain-containing protein n=1 Tax=Streptomyces sp. NPDC056132 TaxID=3345722 RepID=UPI0035D5428F
MSNTSVEQEYRSLLPRLLGLYPRVVGDPAQRRIRQSHAEVGHVAHGWYMRCHRGVLAVLALEAEGLQVEAAPIRRSVVEHVVALKWLAEQGAVVADILRRGAARDADRRKAAVKAANWTSVDMALFDAVIHDAQGLDPQYDTLLSFKHRCDRFGTPHDWTTYLNETAQSHPSWESALPYLDITSGRPMARTTPAPAFDQAGFCTIHLLEALICISQIIDSDYLGAELGEISPITEALIVRQRLEQGLVIPPELQRAQEEQSASGAHPLGRTPPECSN